MFGSGSYSIGELAERAGVSRRAVRFYVQRGLLPEPVGVGRGAHYTDEHLRRLKEVKELQLRGMSLLEIAGGEIGVGGEGGVRGFDGAAAPARVEEPVTEQEVIDSRNQVSHSGSQRAIGERYERIELLPGVELHVDVGRCVLTAADIRRLRLALAGRDGPEQEERM
jgi:hypothetical protein